MNRKEKEIMMMNRRGMRMINGIILCVAVVCAIAQGQDFYPLFVDANRQQDDPHHLTGLIYSFVEFGGGRQGDIRASGTVAFGERLVVTAAHNVFAKSTDGLHMAWATGQLWFPGWNRSITPPASGRWLNEVDPFGPDGILILRDVQAHQDYQSLVEAEDPDEISETALARDIALLRSIHPTAGGNAGWVYVNGREALESDRAKLISGYPHRRTENYFLHEIGPFTRPYRRVLGQYMQVEGVFVGKGASGSGVWVQDAAAEHGWGLAGIHVSGDDPVGAVAIGPDEWNLLSGFAGRTAATPGLPIPQSFADVRIGSAVQLSWTAAPGALQHQVEIWREGRLVYHTTVSRNSVGVTLSNPQLGRYEWRVRGVRNGIEGDWIGAYFDVVPGWRPGDGNEIENRRPEFTWPAVEHATWYQVYVERNGEGHVSQWVNDNIWVPAEDLPSGQYQWWSRAWSPESGLGAWTGGERFTVLHRVPGTVQMIAPQGAQDGYTLTYRWREDPHAAWYQLWVWHEDSGVWHNQWHPSTGATEHSARLSGHPMGRFEWYIRAWSVDGLGPWSRAMAFSTPTGEPSRPMLIRPSGQIQDLDPAFEWEASARATRYRLFARNADTGQAVVDGWITSTTAFVPGGLQPGRYSWWVAAQNESAGSGSVWSDRMDFTIVEGRAQTTGFLLTENRYDHSTVIEDIRADYGHHVRLADWDEVVALANQYGVYEWMDAVGLLEYNDSAFVTRSGARYLVGERHYFITRHNGNRPSYYADHSQIGGNALSLGSWWGTKRALIYIPE